MGMRISTGLGRVFILTIAILNLAAQADSSSVEAEKTVKAADETVQEVSGLVRMIRANPETEVFFKDLKDSLIIPKDSKHNAIYAACEESQRKGKPVRLLIDPKARRILSLPQSTSEKQTGVERPLEHGGSTEPPETSK